MTWMKTEFSPPLQKAGTPQEMRAAIERAYMTNPIVRQVLELGRRQGLSAEDTYSMLAYHALGQLAEANRIMHELASMAPPLPVLVDVVDPLDLKLDGDLPPYRSEKTC